MRALALTTETRPTGSAARNATAGTARAGWHCHPSPTRHPLSALGNQALLRLLHSAVAGRADTTAVPDEPPVTRAARSRAAGPTNVTSRVPDEEGSSQGEQQRTCGPDITGSLTAMLATVRPWFRSLSAFQQHRSCLALGPAAPLVGVNPIMAWDTRELFLPDTGWLDPYFHHQSCGSPRDPGCDTDPTRHLCETSGSCGNSVVVGGKCMLAGTANYALFGTMCRICHDETSQWGRSDMRAIIGAYKAIAGDDASPPRDVASAAYDGTFPALPASAENRGTCAGRCGVTHGGVFDFIWEPYRPR